MRRSTSEPAAPEWARDRAAGSTAGQPGHLAESDIRSVCRSDSDLPTDKQKDYQQPNYDPIKDTLAALNAFQLGEFSLHRDHGL